MASRLALSVFTDVSTINLVRVAGDAFVACVGADGYAVANVLGGESVYVRMNTYPTVFLSNENPLGRNCPFDFTPAYSPSHAPK